MTGNILLGMQNEIEKQQHIFNRRDLFAWDGMEELTSEHLNNS